MRADRLAAAITEAERFLSEAKALAKAHGVAEKERERIRKDPDQPEWAEWQVANPLGGSPATGSVKRRSMDLTRALAEMRKR